MPTLELFFSPQPNMQATMAGLTGIGRWYSNHLNSFLDTLVFRWNPLPERSEGRMSTVHHYQFDNVPDVLSLRAAFQGHRSGV